jgi:hypothetical protein
MAIVSGQIETTKEINTLFASKAVGLNELEKQIQINFFL